MKPQEMLRPFPSILCAMLLCALLSAGGCGVFRGIPTHGGGKRFDEEQRVVFVEDLHTRRSRVYSARGATRTSTSPVAGRIGRCASGARRLLITHRPAELPLDPGLEQAYDGLELDL